MKFEDSQGNTVDLQCKAIGNNLLLQDNQFLIGHYNNSSNSKSSVSSGTNYGTLFCIGNGTATSGSNAFRVTDNGAAFGLSGYNSSGADYAEFFEWLDGNENNEDRVGYFVTLEGEKIKIANENDYILGIVSGNPCIIGNSDECWRNKYIRDEFDRLIMEEQEYTEIIENEVVTKTSMCFKINPNYDESKEYLQRFRRKEWEYIGMIGVLPVRDDGTCQVNGYCTVTYGGIATACERGINSYRVLERVTDNIIKVLFK